MTGGSRDQTRTTVFSPLRPRKASKRALPETDAHLSDSTEPRSSKSHRQQNPVHGQTVQMVLRVSTNKNPAKAPA